MSRAEDLVALGAMLERALRSALEDLDPTALVEQRLPSLPPKRARVRVIAAGKAAAGMAKGALARWGDRIEDTLVVSNVASPEMPRTTSIVAGHPLPDASSVIAAEEALRRAGELTPDDLLLSLISGGASALLAAPPEGMSLAEKREIVAALLEAGAPIQDVNLIRRHLSRIKGGRLAAAARGARVLTLYLCDVIDGAPHDVGSGPSVLDPTTIADAAAALTRFIPARAAEIAARLTESVKPSLGTARARAQEIAAPLSLSRRIADRLGASGLAVDLDAPDRVSIAETVAARIERARTLGPGSAAVISCEPTLVLPTSRGRGGRAGYVALATVRHLPPDVVLLCAASDGVDGSSGHAGAIVWRDAATHATASVLDAALEHFDDAAAHTAMGTSLDLGATAHNLTDVHVLARTRG